MPLLIPELVTATKTRFYERFDGAPATIFSDAFTRADSTTTLGTDWTALSGTWGITSNKAYNASVEASVVAVHDAGTPDVVTQCVINGTLSSGSDYSSPCLVVRCLNANNLLYVVMNAGAIKLMKIDAGVFSQLDTAAQTTSDATNYTIKVVMAGTNLQTYVDGVRKLNTTLSGGDTKYCGYTSVGMIHALAGSPATAATWDTFSVTELPFEPSKLAWTDLNSKLSRSDGFAFDQNGSWDQERLTYQKALTPQYGLTIEQEMTWSTFGSCEWGPDPANPVAVASDIVPGWYTQGAGGVPRATTAAGVYKIIPLTMSTSTSYKFRVQLLNPGAIWWVQIGDVWYPIWHVATGYTSSLYLGFNNNAAVGSSALWRAGYLPVPSPRFEMASPTITPTLGSELVVNGGFDADTDWTKGTGWSIGSGVATYAGVGAGNLTQSILTVGTWYSATFTTASVVGSLLKAFFGTDVGPAVSTSATFTHTRRATGDATAGFLIVTTGATGTVDNVSYKAITLASTLTLIGDPGRRDGIYDCSPTLTAGTQEGMALWVNDETNPTYMLVGYHDGTNCKLDKCENGSWTNLISAAATYSADAQLRVISLPSGSNMAVALFYNGTVVGTTQTVTPTSYGTKFCRFSTYASNSGGTLACRVGMP